MVQATIYRVLVPKPETISNQFGETEYQLINRNGSNQIARTDRLTSKSTGFCQIKLKSPAIVQIRPREDTISIALKPIQTTGVGPFTCSKDNLLGIAAVSQTTPLWTAELPGTQLFCLSVKRSLLAKHAFDIVDTTVLESMRFLTLDGERSEALKEKLNQLMSSTDSTQALDIRLAHLLLSICEIVQHTAETFRQSSAEKLWLKLRNTPAHEITKPMLQAQCELSENQLNHLFKRALGLSARQFITNYQLNCIRQALLAGRQSFTDCVTMYGYNSPDQLYRAYRRLFDDQPPLNHR
ncbi:MAG: AraC-like DNA-binding protein [Patiriisocius sp.]|jgi:AraC-like DNA-binding protein